MISRLIGDGVIQDIEKNAHKMWIDMYVLKLVAHWQRPIRQFPGSKR